MPAARTNEPFTRSNIRLPANSYRGSRVYFLTLCCHRRQPLLSAAPTVARVLDHLHKGLAREGFALHAFCAMPDHLHLLVGGPHATSDLLSFVARFKQLSAVDHWRRTRQRLWQFKFYDHILRRDAALDAAAWYIWMNPVRQGLCRHPYDFPFSGSSTLPWPPPTPQIPSTTPWSPPWTRKSPDEIPKPNQSPKADQTPAKDAGS